MGERHREIAFFDRKPTELFGRSPKPELSCRNFKQWIVFVWICFVRRQSHIIVLLNCSFFLCVLPPLTFLCILYSTKTTHWRFDYFNDNIIKDIFCHSSSTLFRVFLRHGGSSSMTLDFIVLGPSHFFLFPYWSVILFNCISCLNECHSVYFNQTTM